MLISSQIVAIVLVVQGLRRWRAQRRWGNGTHSDSTQDATLLLPHDDRSADSSTHHQPSPVSCHSAPQLDDIAAYFDVRAHQYVAAPHNYNE